MLVHRPWARLRIVIATILTLNALEVFSQLSFFTSPVITRDALQWIDTLILMNIAYAFLLIPNEVSPKVHRWHIGAMLLWTAAYWPFVAAPPRIESWVHVGGHNLAWAAIVLAFAFHALPKIRALPKGPLRSQSLLFSTALLPPAAMTQIMEAYAFTRALLRGDLDPVFASRPLDALILQIIFDRGLAILLVWLLFVATASTLREAGKRGGDWALLSPFALTLAVTIPILIAEGANSPAKGVLFAQLREAPSQFFRPLVIIIAMIRYDVFSLPRGIKRTLLPLTGLTGLAIGFLGVSLVPYALDPQFTPEGFLFAFLVIILAIAGYMGVAAGRGELQRRQNFVEFRLHLERNPAANTATMDALRREFKISRKEAEALSAKHEARVQSMAPGPVA